MSEEKLSVRLEAEADRIRGKGVTPLGELLRDAADLARRVEEAPVVPVYFEKYTEGEFFADIEAGTIPCELAGQRVRLVMEG